MGHAIRRAPTPKWVCLERIPRSSSPTRTFARHKAARRPTVVNTSATMRSPTTICSIIWKYGRSRMYDIRALGTERLVRPFPVSFHSCYLCNKYGLHIAPFMSHCSLKIVSCMRWVSRSITNPRTLRTARGWRTLGRATKKWTRKFGRPTRRRATSSTNSLTKRASETTKRMSCAWRRPAFR